MQSFERQHAQQSRRSSVRKAAAKAAAVGANRMAAAEDRLPEEDRMAAPCIGRNWDENVSLYEPERREPLVLR
jgi:hypothetical protein